MKYTRRVKFMEIEIGEVFEHMGGVYKKINYTTAEPQCDGLEGIKSHFNEFEQVYASE